ncbi:hypothetical protein Y032_0140g2154 [Ancylostoma ceylanicum]|uniref:Uncharacterized protein n=1 Tax=Ancylostoma ceylanicum TaxID=53326 RepID=A0A016T412_9BILA|nr:hypothetical protein Y032_0140g2154 [Ancylostoma ceylanicum]
MQCRATNSGEIGRTHCSVLSGIGGFSDYLSCSSAPIQGIYQCSGTVFLPVLLPRGDHELILRLMQVMQCTTAGLTCWLTGSYSAITTAPGSPASAGRPDWYKQIRMSTSIMLVSIPGVKCTQIVVWS